jgi:hypothetical protein
VAATASQAMRGLIAGGAREIDWSPVVPSIRALLDGTNVFVLDVLLSALASTAIDRAHASELLRDGGANLLLARLAAVDVRTRASAHQFLMRISGGDLGEDPAAWAAWVDLLPRGGPVLPSTTN